MIPKSTLVIRSRDAAAFLLCACSLASTAAEDALNVGLPLFNYRFFVEREVNSARADPAFTGGAASVPSARPPQTVATSKSMALPEKRGGELSEMLQNHEFSFGASTLRTLGMNDLASGSGEDVKFKALKLRASRSKLMVRADFVFK